MEKLHRFDTNLNLVNINGYARFSFGNSMKGKFLILLLFSLPFSVFGQIKIKVFDEFLVPISGVQLVSENPNISLISNDQGLIELEVNYVARALLRHVSYAEFVIEDISSGTTEIVLKPKVTTLGAVEVEAFGRDRELTNVAGSVRKLQSDELNRFDETSLVRPLNLTPGIRFEERAGASYRVSIRGSSIRSPFGIRNVKIYWNGIPFTDAGGNTFLNLLDRQNMNALEIMKGPSGSMFGAGTGGVMKFNSTDYSSIANSATAQMTVGSFGLLRYGVTLNTANDKTAWTVKFAHHESDGYRTHNALNKNVLELNGLIYANESRTIDASILYSDLFYEIPGGLNADQFEEDPTQARPRSEEQNSSIDHQMLMAKLGQTYQFSSFFSNQSDVFFTRREFENPFILDYKQDEESRVGVRSVFKYSPVEKLQLQAGGEYQIAWLDARNYGNVGGERDTIRFADELTNTDFNAFINLDYDFNESWSLEAGLSLANTVYDINRTVDRIRNNPQAFKKRFDSSLNPRIAVNKVISKNLSAHFSISTGFSVPTTLEVRTNEGSLNTDLQPERGINYEFNLRGGNSDLSYDLSIFHFDLNESITTFTNSEGVVLFRNSGSLKQQGFELEVLKPWLSKESGFLRSLSSRLAFTYHNFSFNEYVSGGDDFSGNDLTGTAPIIVGFTTDMVFQGGFFLNASYLYTDPIPLNDENTVYSEASNLVFAKLGFRRSFKKVDTELSIGVDNLLDIKYSLGNDLNPFGGRYYQPAPTRNFAVDLKIRIKR